MNHVEKPTRPSARETACPYDGKAGSDVLDAEMGAETDTGTLVGARTCVDTPGSALPPGILPPALPPREPPYGLSHDASMGLLS